MASVVSVVSFCVSFTVSVEVSAMVEKVSVIPLPVFSPQPEKLIKIDIISIAEIIFLILYYLSGSRYTLLPLNEGVI